MKRNECDGQSVYSAQIVDDYVVEVLHKCFERIKATPKDAAIEKKFRTQLSQIRQEIKKLEKESETLKRKLGELTEEIANALIGDSKFTPDVLSMAIENTKTKIAENARKISEKQSKLKNTEVELKNILSLKYTVDENRNNWYPTDNEITKEVVKENYNELFYPTETQWREKTVADFKAATEGVLKAKLK